MAKPFLLPRSRVWFILVVLGISAFWPTLRTGFMWDDHVMIENNPQMQTWSFDALRKDFSTDMFCGRGDPYFRPLQVLSNPIDYTLWGPNPLGHHLTQLLIHLGNALLFFELLAVLGAPFLLGLIAASFFVVHPIIVEQLMIIAGRGEILSLFFMLASAWCFLNPDAQRGPGRPWMLTLGYALFSSALLTKESAIVFPVLLALLFYLQSRPDTLWVLGRSFKDYAHIGGLFLLILPYLVLRHQAVGAAAFPQSPSLWARFLWLAFPSILLKYAGLLVWPWNLHSHRLMPHLSPFWPLTTSLCIGGIAWLIHRKERVALVGVGWFILCLLPKTPVMMLGNFRLGRNARSLEEAKAAFLRRWGVMVPTMPPNFKVAYLAT